MMERKIITIELFFFLFIVSTSAGDLTQKSTDLANNYNLGEKIGLGILFGFFGLVALVFIIGGAVLIIREFLDRRARKMALQVHYAARRERVRVSIYDTSDPAQFGQTECAVCLEDFTNTQSYSALPCGHILCEECMSIVVLKRETCPSCRVNILD